MRDEIMNKTVKRVYNLASFSELEIIKSFPFLFLFENTTEHRALEWVPQLTFQLRKIGC
jgi:hypothetical protein